MTKFKPIKLKPETHEKLTDVRLSLVQQGVFNDWPSLDTVVEYLADYWRNFGPNM